MRERRERERGVDERERGAGVQEDWQGQEKGTGRHVSKRDSE